MARARPRPTSTASALPNHERARDGEPGLWGCGLVFMMLRLLEKSGVRAGRKAEPRDHPAAPPAAASIAGEVPLHQAVDMAGLGVGQLANRAAVQAQCVVSGQAICLRLLLGAERG